MKIAFLFENDAKSFTNPFAFLLHIINKGYLCFIMHAPGNPVFIITPPSDVCRLAFDMQIKPVRYNSRRRKITFSFKK